MLVVLGMRYLVWVFIGLVVLVLGGWKPCVGWHSDDEPLFGECGDAKLIVSVSLGSSALFRWRRQSCPDDASSTSAVACSVLVCW